VSDEVQMLTADEIEEWVAFLKETAPRPGSSDHQFTFSRAPFERIIHTLGVLQAENMALRVERERLEAKNQRLKAEVAEWEERWEDAGLEMKER
jgi:hypothetical protein